MASMTYCMFENTAGELSQVVDAMENAQDLDGLDLNDYEQEGFHTLFTLAKQYIRQYERLEAASE